MADFIKKPVATLLVMFLTLFSFSGCFGSFPLMRKGYQFVDGLSVGNSWTTKILKSAIAFVTFWVLGTLTFILDLLVFNVYEFWTDKVLFSKSDFDSDGKLVRTIRKGDETATLTYLEFGKKLEIRTEKNGKTDLMIIQKDRPGKVLKKVNGQWTEFEMKYAEFNENMVISAVSGNKTNSRVFDKKELNPDFLF